MKKNKHTTPVRNKYDEPVEGISDLDINHGYFTAVLVVRRIHNHFGVDYKTIADVFEKYKFYSLFDKLDDSFQDMGIDGIIEYLDDIVRETGGKLL
jgi:hypothetical protein